MNEPIHRVVYKEKYGPWVNKREYAVKPTSTHFTQLAAVASAKEMLRREGGGTLIIRGPNGLIRERIDVRPGSGISVFRTGDGFK